MYREDMIPPFSVAGCKRKEIARIMYLFGLMMYVFCMSMRTTMYSLYTVTLIGKYLAVGIVAVKIVLFDRYSLKKLLVAGGMCVAAMITFVFGGYGEPICLMVLILGAEGVDFNDVVRAYIMVTVVVMLLAATGCALGFIENVRATSRAENTAIILKGIYLLDAFAGINSFGIQYYTDFGAHILYLWISFVYLKREALKYRYGLIAIFSGALVYFFSEARLDSILIAFLGAAVIFVCYSEGKNKERSPSVMEKAQFKKNLELLGHLSMPVLFVTALTFTLLYDESNPFIVRVDNLFSFRLQYGSADIKKYGISLVGQWIEMIGHGQANIVEGEYNFLDCSYLYILLQNGIIFFAVILLINQYIIRRYREDKWMMILWIFIAVSSTVDHHLMDTAYNIFLIAAGCEIAVCDLTYRTACPHT